MIAFLKEKRVREDFSNYEPGKGSDGGRYGFWTIRKWYKDVESWKTFTIDFKRTTAQVSYCEMCGSFRPTRVVGICDESGNIFDHMEVCQSCVKKWQEAIPYKDVAVFE